MATNNFSNLLKTPSVYSSGINAEGKPFYTDPWGTQHVGAILPDGAAWFPNPGAVNSGTAEMYYGFADDPTQSIAGITSPEGDKAINAEWAKQNVKQGVQLGDQAGFSLPQDQLDYLYGAMRQDRRDNEKYAKKDGWGLMDTLGVIGLGLGLGNLFSAGGAAGAAGASGGAGGLGASSIGLPDLAAVGTAGAPTAASLASTLPQIGMGASSIGLPSLAAVGTAGAPTASSLASSLPTISGGATIGLPNISSVAGTPNANTLAQTLPNIPTPASSGGNVLSNFIDNPSMKTGLPLAANVGGGLLSAAASNSAANQISNAAKDAASASAVATQSANDLAKYMYDTSRSDLAPWRQTGTNALNQLSLMTGLTKPTGYALNGSDPTSQVRQLYSSIQQTNPDQQGMDYWSGQLKSGRGAQDVAKDFYTSAASFKNSQGYQPNAALAQGYLDSGTNQQPYQFNSTDPSYQFRFNQGQNALERSQAARGMNLSGNALAELNNYGQNMASTEYGNQFNRLSALAGYGQNATNTGANLGQNYATNVGNNLINQGNQQGNSYLASANANAAGRIGTANAFGSMLGNIFNPW